MQTILDVLRFRIEEHIRGTTNITATGACPDYATYRQMCGIVEGLNKVLADIKDLETEQEELEDD